MWTERPKTEPETIDLCIGGQNLTLLSSPTLFTPNTTTNILFEAAFPVAGLSVLDLGCGVGPVAIAAALSGAASVTAADVMEEACRLTARNAELNGVADRVTAVPSYLFRDLKPAQFDLIISDVSGMSEQIARRSPWFPDPIPTGGVDGTELAIEVVNSAPKYLRPGGRLVFPVLSLSRATAIEEAARSVFGAALTKVREKSMPFHPDLCKDREWLAAQKAEGLLDYSMRGSRLCWSLTIYSAQQPTVVSDFAPTASAPHSVAS
jgi:methylase of polypeptide subunit release factors